MQEERKVTVYTCDDPKCTSEIICQDDEPADGFYGKVLHVGSFGGNGADWYACSSVHIKAAVIASLEREQR